MTGSDDRPEEFGAAYWQERYRSGEGTGRSDASPSLVAEADGLAAGTALDAGCGRGADAIWLGARGWRVTAVDVSADALGYAQQAVREAGAGVAERIEWVRADLTDWEPGVPFDLVTSHYVHAPGPAEDLFGRLASWVAPGGTLLVVGHDGGHGHGHAHPAGAQVQVSQVTAALAEGAWEVLVAESRTHTVRRPGVDATTLHDVVVRARRTGPDEP